MLIFLPCNAEEIIYLHKKRDEKASRILYEYCLGLFDYTPEQVYEIYGYKLFDVNAVFYDLNNDGVDEIIGYIEVPSSYSRDGANLYILKKDNNKYEDISGINFSPSSGVHVLDSSSNGYFDINVVVTMQFKTVSAKYNKQYYEYFLSN